ncbi:hypothetical protein CEXT_802321 [Caerostris extrusa]|uniref:Uncharacterized protein n=1 Tax=Caerostris extrusa TaxID=172846 RepID=A0AAV4PDW9_CAEEX|nr:hypothetical protein CEXT_802321 [Caerostris extrusa]
MFRPDLKIDFRSLTLQFEKEVHKSAAAVSSMLLLADIWYCENYLDGRGVCVWTTLRGAILPISLSMKGKELTFKPLSHRGVGATNFSTCSHRSDRNRLTLSEVPITSKILIGSIQVI